MVAKTPCLDLDPTGLYDPTKDKSILAVTYHLNRKQKSIFNPTIACLNRTLLHTDAFAHRRFYTQTPLHIDAFTHRHFYTQTILHTDTFTHRSFYTQKLLHTDSFTHRRFYTQTLLHTDKSTSHTSLVTPPRSSH